MRYIELNTPSVNYEQAEKLSELLKLRLKSPSTLPRKYTDMLTNSKQQSTTLSTSSHTLLDLTTLLKSEYTEKNYTSLDVELRWLREPKEE